MNIKISIIIPCFKTENTLEETLESVFNQNYSNWEAIIVNDGSPDGLEKIAVNWVEKDNRFRYFKKENGGLGSARNYGIKKAKGIYILPLDSDNKIRPDFIAKAIPIMERQINVGVLYGNAMYFGERQGKWEVGGFDKFKLLHSNFIDACAILRKSMFDTVGGYEENLPHQGIEDWDLWLKVLKTNFQFFYLNAITFDYRVTSDSMIRKLSKENRKKNTDFLKNIHSDLYVKEFSSMYVDYNLIKNRKSIFERLIFKLRDFSKISTM